MIVHLCFSIRQWITVLILMSTKPSISKLLIKMDKNARKILLNWSGLVRRHMIMMARCVRESSFWKKSLKKINNSKCSRHIGTTLPARSLVQIRNQIPFRPLMKEDIGYKEEVRMCKLLLPMDTRSNIVIWTTQITSNV